MAHVQIVIGMSTCLVEQEAASGVAIKTPCVFALRHEIEDTSGLCDDPAGLLASWLFADGLTMLLRRSKEMQAACGIVPSSVEVHGACTLQEALWTRALAREVAASCRKQRQCFIGCQRASGASDQAIAVQRHAELVRQQQDRLVELARQVAVHVSDGSSGFVLPHGSVATQPTITYAARFIADAGRLL